MELECRIQILAEDPYVHAVSFDRSDSAIQAPHRQEYANLALQYRMQS